MAAAIRRSFDTLYFEMDFAIDAPTDRVWKALTAQLSTWWPKEFAAGGPKNQRMVLEPRLGGRLYEDWGNGDGLTWFTVETFEAPRRIEFVGRTSKDFGGPAMQIVELHLQPSGKNTTLRLIDTVFGAVDDKALEADLRGGWTKLLGEAFKKHAESAS